jgi:hypothetical protein
MDKLTFGGIFTITCVDKNGNIKWEERTPNLVVDEGLIHILDITFMGGTQHTNFYIGLMGDDTTVTAGDTMSSHQWTEVDKYTEGTRPEFIEIISGKTVNNSGANIATFSINDSAIVGGAFITSDDTKLGTSGTLMAASGFSNGDKNVSDGDTIKVMYEFRAASS